MKSIFTFFCCCFFTFYCFAQNFNGQWKGTFVDKSTAALNWGGDKCDYVLDISVDGTDVSGYSYTYYSNEGRKFYTICRIEGFVDKKRKYIEIKEVSRTKTNVPFDVTNSFQIHKLSWSKQGADEVIEGPWVPVPNQKGANNGYGTTVLVKRQLTEISQLAKTINERKDPSSTIAKSKKNIIYPTEIAKTKIYQKQPIKPVTKPIVKTAAIGTIKPNTVKNVAAIKKDTVAKPTIITDVKKAPIYVEKVTPTGFEKRNNSVIQTVVVTNPTVKIELYDNGDVDGDSVTLFYNGNVLLAHKKLTEKAIILDLPINNDEVNELVMYADNLGYIPPNTALLVVTDGKKRYEVRVTSDLKKSGTIRFVHKAE